MFINSWVPFKPKQTMVPAAKANPSAARCSIPARYVLRESQRQQAETEMKLVQAMPEASGEWNSVHVAVELFDPKVMLNTL